MSVRMTERAAEQFKSVCTSKSFPIEKTMLRLDAQPSEQEGKLRLSLRFDDHTPREEDVVEETAGAQLVIDKGLEEALGDVRVDFKEDGAGFVLERVR